MKHQYNNPKNTLYDWFIVTISFLLFVIIILGYDNYNQRSLVKDNIIKRELFYKEMESNSIFYQTKCLRLQKRMHQLYLHNK